MPHTKWWPQDGNKTEGLWSVGLWNILSPS